MLQEILKLVKNSENFVITSHVNPDGDSIGSEIAMYLYLKKLGKNVRVINYSLTPNNYRFLDENNIIEKFDEHQHIEVLKGADIIFILDTNEYSRIRTMAEYVQQSKAKKICIDHHLGTERNGFDYYILDTNSPATGEILFNFFEYSNNITMDKEIAEALYTAIMTDTGSFRFPRTDSDTHKIASKLIQAGADPVKLFAEVYDKATIGRLKLLSKFLGNIKLEYNNKLIYGVLKIKDFEETGTNVFDTEGFSHYLMSIDTVQISLIFTETDKGVKVSYRSKGDIFVNELAKENGGGGHQNAAGSFIVNGKLDEVKNEVIIKAKKYIK